MFSVGNPIVPCLVTILSLTSNDTARSREKFTSWLHHFMYKERAFNVSTNQELANGDIAGIIALEDAYQVSAMIMMII